MGEHYLSAEGARLRPVVVNAGGSPFAAQRPLPVTAVKLSDRFWTPRIAVNRTSTLSGQFRKLEESKCLDNFRRAADKPGLPFTGWYFTDSDLYKWLEAASWSLASFPDDPDLIPLVDEAIDLVAGAQDDDGYLNTYFTVDRVAERWTNFDLHEMYCAGHLIQAAIAHCRATGNCRLFEIASRNADHICRLFGPAEGQRQAVCGHEEIEMALVELYRASGESRYLETAIYFINARGHGLTSKTPGEPGSAYFQDHVPFRDLNEVTGHAVRMMYLDCGAADVYLEDGDPTLKLALDAQWQNMTERRMYVTGGVGSRWEGEAFGKDYELPSELAYTETCAAIGSVMWNWRMLLATGEAKYVDLLERALYNGVISGLSLSGDEYFYQNPLTNDGSHRRQAWFGCACCPPNVARLLASLSGYVATVSRDTLTLHLYASERIETNLPAGGRLAFTVETDYPWDGSVAITVEEAPAAETTLRLRIPEWADGATLALNGARTGDALVSGKYAEVRRIWSKGDTLTLVLPMSVRILRANPAVYDTNGRLCLSRGPLIYCLEHADNPGTDLRGARIVPDGEWKAESRADLLGGIVTLSGEAQIAPSAGWEGNLYLLAATTGRVAASTSLVTAIPYYAWANREPGYMTVWIKEAE